MKKERYIHPLDTENNVAIGVGLPLSDSGNSFFSLNYTTKDQARTNLKNLLLTNKGERIMRPEYGCNLKRMLFDTSPDQKIKEAIENSVYEWLPYINIETLIVDRDEINEHLVNIIISYNILEDTETTDELSISLSVS